MKSSDSKPNPDSILIQKAQEGDRDSLKALLREIAPSVSQWALARTGDPDSAADLSQEVLLLLLRKISTYRGEARFMTWLFTVTRNQALEQIRRRGRDEQKMARWKTEIKNLELPSDSDGSELDRTRIRRLVESFVSDLPPRQREVFQLSELQGLSSQEVGTILDLAPGSVRAALLKARRSLRRKILEQHPEFVEEYLK